MLPTSETERDDARVALAFQAYAATHGSAAEYLEQGNVLVRDYLAGLI